MNINSDRIVFLGTMAVGLACVGCSPYWTKAEWSAQPTPQVIEVPGPFLCNGKRSLGCYWPPPANLIYIMAGMEQSLRDCVIAHEVAYAKHSLGFKHDDRSNYAIDCGNGDMWLGESPR